MQAESPDIEKNEVKQVRFQLANGEVVAPEAFSETDGVRVASATVDLSSTPTLKEGEIPLFGGENWQEHIPLLSMQDSNAQSLSQFLQYMQECYDPDFSSTPYHAYALHGHFKEWMQTAPQYPTELLRDFLRANPDNALLNQLAAIFSSQKVAPHLFRLIKDAEVIERLDDLAEAYQAQDDNPWGFTEDDDDSRQDECEARLTTEGDDDEISFDADRLGLVETGDAELKKDIASVRAGSVEKPASFGLNVGCNSVQSNRSFSLEKVPGVTPLLMLFGFNKKEN